MKLWRKMIALNLALLMVLSLMPATVLAQVLESVIYYDYPESEHTYTPEESGVYKFYLEAQSSSGGSACSGTLSMYSSSKDVSEINDYRTTNSYTYIAALEAGVEYDIEHIFGDSRSGTSFTLSVEKQNMEELKLGSLQDIEFGEISDTYIQIEVDSSGWYELLFYGDSALIEAAIYGDFTNYMMGYYVACNYGDGDAGSAYVYLERGDTYYLKFFASTNVSSNDDISYKLNEADDNELMEAKLGNNTVECSTYFFYNPCNLVYFDAPSSGKYRIEVDGSYIELRDEDGDILDSYMNGKASSVCIDCTLTKDERYYIGMGGENEEIDLTITAWIDVDGIDGQILFDEATGTILDAESSVTIANIPAQINGVDVVAIGSGAFYGCSLLILSLPEGLESIEYYAFSGGAMGPTLKIPDSVTSIGNYAFSYCTSLESVEIGSGLSSIGVATFLGCSGLTSITVSDDNKYYSSQDGVLFNGDKTELITYPVNKSDTSYIVPSTVVTIGQYAFCYSELEEISISGSLESVESYAFRFCSNLTDVYYAGSESEWEDISIGYNNTYLTDATMHYDWSIATETWITVDGIVGGKIQFDYDTGTITAAETTITSANIPSIINGVVVVGIGNQAFYGCEDLVSLTIPNTVKSIGVWAFMECGALETVVISENVEEIGDNAFAYGYSLKSVTILSDVESWGSNVFVYCSNDLVIYGYADSSVEQYAKDNGITFVAITAEENVTYIPASGTSIVSPKTEFPMFVIEYQDSIEETADVLTGYVKVNWDKEPLAFYRVSDDECVFTVPQVSDSTWTTGLPYAYYGSTSAVQIYSSNFKVYLESNTDYYVKMGEGFMEFTNGSLVPAIEKGDWVFSVDTYIEDPFSTSEKITFKTGIDSEKGNEYVDILVNWDDAWFENDTTTYIEDLSVTAMGLSGAAYNKTNIYNALEVFEFEDIEQTNYSYPHTETDNDVVAYNIAQKTIYDDTEEVTLIAVIVKGTSSDEEWYSNFNIQTGDTHYGFLSSANDVIASLSQYVEEHSLDENKLKVLVTGHSRGAAVANLVAASATSDNAYDDVYGYTFATPNVSVNAVEKGYENIFNIVNNEDFVPRAILNQWGYSRYGIDLVLPSKSHYVSSSGSTTYTTMYNRMADYYEAITDSEFEAFGGTDKVDDLVADMYSLAKSSWDYHNVKYNYVEQSYLGLLDIPIVTGSMYQYYNVLANYLCNGTATNLAAYAASIKGDFSDLTWFFITQSGDVSVLKNTVFGAHSPAGYMSWLQVNEAEDLFGKTNTATYTTFKRLTVACPVDVYVYDENGTLVASVVDEEIVVDTLAVSVEDGVKTIDLPSGQEYSVEVIAREGGTVDYSVEEMTVSGSNVTTERTIVYEDIEIVEDDTLEGEIPSAINESVGSYTLEKNEEAITPTAVVDGPIEIESTYQYIDVSITGDGTIDPEVLDGQSMGIVKGESQTFTFTASSGNYISDVIVDGVSVGAVDSYTFESLEVDHTLAVIFMYDDTTTTSSSSKTKSYYIKVTATGNGTIDPDGGADSMYQVSQYDDVEFDFDPDSGYEVTDVIVNGKSVGVLDEYEFENIIDTMQTLEVVFGKSSSSSSSSSSDDDDEDEDSDDDSDDDVVEIELPFADVDEDDDNYDGISYVYENGIMAGITSEEFGADYSITRAMIAAILYRINGSEAVEAEILFEDVPADKYYYDAVVWGKDAGVIAGVSTTEFAPNTAITNEQFIAFLYRYASVLGMDMSIDGDTDLSGYAISNYAMTAVAWALENGIIEGDGLQPKEEALRGDVATALMNFMEMMQ